MSFLSQLQNETWYSNVAAAFAAAGIAPALWESTLSIEDAGLDPKVIVQDHYADGSPAGPRVGLFQIDPNGMGATVGATALQDPLTNARIAAAAMAAQIAREGTANAPLSTQLQSIERAGWPGDLSEDAARQSALTTLSQQGSIGGAVVGSVTDPITSGITAAGNAIAAKLNFPSSTQINTWLVQGLIGSVMLALIAGGFALLAAPQIQQDAPLAAAA